MSAVNKESQDCQDSNESNSSSIFTYIKPVLSLAWPNLVANIAWSIQGAILLYYFGLLGSVKFLDAASLAASLEVVFIYSVQYGILNAASTFITQSMGKKEYEVCGIILNRTLMVSFAVITPFCILFLFAGEFFEMCGVDKEVAGYTGLYVKLLIPSVYITVPAQVYERFLQMQQILIPPMIIKLVVTCLGPLYYYAFAFWLDMGYIGVAIGSSFGMLISAVALILYIKISKCCEHTMTPFTCDAFKGWKEYFEIATPSMLMSCLEFSALEILNVVCGVLGVAELGANSILMQLSMLMLCVRGSIGSAACTLIGNSVGEGNVANAKKYMLTGVFVGLITAVVLGITFIVFRDNIIVIFTRDMNVLSIMRILAYIFVVQQIIDLVQSIIGMSIVGMGVQANISIGNVICYYVIYLPTALLLAFPAKLDIYGIWIGCCIGVLSVLSWYIWMLLRLDWEQAVANAHRRLEAVKTKGGEENKKAGYDAIDQSL